MEYYFIQYDDKWVYSTHPTKFTKDPQKAAEFNDADKAARYCEAMREEGHYSPHVCVIGLGEWRCYGGKINEYGEPIR